MSENYQPSLEPKSKANQTLLKLANFITKNALLVTIITLLALVTLTASAFELVAPVEYKPSSMLGMRKPPSSASIDPLKGVTGVSQNSNSSQSVAKGGEGNKIQPLIADSEHDVVVLEECDLAVRYKKATEIGVFKNFQNSSSNIVVFGSKTGPQSVLDKAESVDCDTQIKDTSGANGQYKNDFESKTIQDIPYLNQGSKSVLQVDATSYLMKKALPTQAYKFIGNKGFLVGIVKNSKNNYITEIQFNSLAPSIPSVKLENTQTSISSQSSPVLANKPQTYTNPYYPNLKINYNDSWEISTERGSVWDSLSEDRIILSKGNSKLKFRLTPTIPIGCSTLDSLKIYSITDNLERIHAYSVDPKDHNKIIDTRPNTYDYRKTEQQIGCNGIANIWLKTNTFYNNLSDKDKKSFSIIPNKDLIKDDVLYYVSYTSLESNNPTEILEADEIIKNSVFE